jgi:hypothetical protein
MVRYLVYSLIFFCPFGSLRSFSRYGLRPDAASSCRIIDAEI